MVTDERFHEILRSKWAMIKQPVRPSREENRLYERYVIRASRNNEKELLILGATPDLRDLAIRHGLKPVSSDLDKRIWEAMTDFMEESGDEEFVHGNWLDLPTNRKYSLVLGDGSLNMLSEKDARLFLAKTAEVLAKDGVSVQRLMYVNQDLRVPDFIRAVVEYRANKLPTTLHMYTMLLVNSIRENQYSHLTKEDLFEQILFEYLSEDEADSIRPLLYGSTLYFPKRSDLERMLHDHFRIEEVVESRGPGYWDMVAQYVLRHKA